MICAICPLPFSSGPVCTQKHGHRTQQRTRGARCWAAAGLLLSCYCYCYCNCRAGLGWAAGLLLSVLQHMAANYSCGRHHPALTCTTVQQYCSLQFTNPHRCCAFSSPAARLHRLLVLH